MFLISFITVYHNYYEENNVSRAPKDKEKKNINRRIQIKTEWET